MNTLRFFMIIIFALHASEASAAFDKLTKKSYEESKTGKAIVVYGVNWGIQWGCSQLDNAQLQNLTFSQVDSASKRIDQDKITLKTPAKLLSGNKSIPYAIIVDPGKYALTGFDVKIAKSSREIGHIKKDVEDLFKNGEPLGGTFEVSAGEVVYIGDFGLDCVGEPIPWRYYVQQEDFERYVDQFKKKYRFLMHEKVVYRLFQTNKFGN